MSCRQQAVRARQAGRQAGSKAATHREFDLRSQAQGRVIAPLLETSMELGAEGLVGNSKLHVESSRS